MNITVTARELLDKDVWVDACELLDISVYAVAEGMDPETSYDLTEEQAAKLGLLEVRQVITKQDFTQKEDILMGMLKPVMVQALGVLCSKGYKILAIRLIREYYNVGLPMSKRLVEMAEETIKDDRIEQTVSVERECMKKMIDEVDNG